MNAGRSRHRRRLRRLFARLVGFVLTGRVCNGETMWTLRRRDPRRVRRELSSFGCIALATGYFLFVVPADVRAFLETGWLLIAGFAALPFVLQYVAAKVLVNLEYPGNDLDEARKALRRIRSE